MSRKHAAKRRNGARTPRSRKQGRQRRGVQQAMGNSGMSAVMAARLTARGDGWA
jgi:hypothetical protein